MLTIIILIFLFLSALIGYRRGLIASLVTIGGYLVSFWVAWRFAAYPRQWLLNLFSTADRSLINGVAFFGTFLVCYLVVIRVGRILKTMVQLPILKQLNSLLGAVAGFLMCYGIILVALNIMMVANDSWFTTQYVNSGLAQIIVNQTPLITHDAVNQWLNSN
ncbi:CvpA family protein [Lactobacillus sp. Sy-1]|uniref:CvpA family protein n=1 Tax=Lactobacillus sp. Sy-1 TaxID=2109645 RepID=UPI001C59A472|nr:CvpA family protein [Lactobacillus sp. Sy-1]MBW1605780.1 CvpA family protein [Lactobacillus sp. Sy-1]